MGRKITLASITLTLFLITASAVTPSNYAVEWSADIRLTLDDDADSSPSITQTIDGNIWVAWSSFRTGNYEIFYKVYDGSSWSSAVQLTTDPDYDWHPAIMQASDSNIWIVWDSNRMGTDDFEIFYKVYDGSSWSSAVQLTTDPHWDWHPAIMQASDSNIWVVWESDRNENDLDLYYKVFDGSSWSNSTQITSDPYANDEYPSIMQTKGGMVWIAFTKATETEVDIYYKLFNGTSWSDDVRLTWDPNLDLHPSIMQANDGAIWVLWDSDRNGHDDNIYYKVADPCWTLDTKLTTDQSDDFRPSIAQAADGTIWVVWTSTRHANYDIYYRTTIVSPHHDIAVVKVTTNSTTPTRGKTVSIEVTIQNQGTYGETFEMQCYANSTLVGSATIFLSPGETNKIYPPFEWNTTGVPRGQYIISASATAVTNETDLADNYKEAVEPVEVRLLGDICGVYDGDILPIPDGEVSAIDFAMIALPGHMFGEYPTWDPEWGPICDVSEDGRITVYDLMIVGVHYGET